MGKGKLINLKKIYILPLVITTIITLVLAITFFNVSTRSFKSIYAKSGSDISKTYAERVVQSIAIEKQIIENLNERLIAAASMVIYHRDMLSNEYLEEIASRQQVHYIWWYNPEGEILYDSTDTFVGWKSTPGDPIHNFMVSGDDIFIEGIRESTESDDFYMVIYKRASDGYFVETALNADYAIELIDMHSYKNVVKDIVENNSHVEYAFIIDDTKEIVADSRPNNETTNINFYNDAFLGETISQEIYYSVSDHNVLEFATPIIVDDEVIAVLSVGYSLDFYRETSNYIILILISVAIGTIITFGIVEIFQLIKPLIVIENAISSFDLDTGTYERPKNPTKTFERAFNALDSLSYRIQAANRETKALYEEVKALAMNDFLTNLPNRYNLTNKLEELINENQEFAVLFIDIDDFKIYNDTKGHLFGDRLLIQISEILQSGFYNNYFISRYGGDEFIVIIKTNSKEAIDNVITNLYNDLTEPIEIEDSTFVINLSIGISMYPIHGDNPTDLIQNADAAMFESKSRGKNKHVYYDELKKDLK